MAAALERRRLADLQVPPDAQQAAALLQQRNRFAAEQPIAEAAIRSATMVSDTTPPQTPPNSNINVNPVIKTGLDAAVAGSTYGDQTGAGIQANGQEQQIQRLNNFIRGKVDVSLANMAPDRMPELLARTSDQVKHPKMGRIQ